MNPRMARRDHADDAGGDVRIRYTKAEAARQLSISERTLDRLREDGKIIARIDGGRVFFDHTQLVSYARSCPAEECA